MSVRIVQFRDADGERRVAVIDGDAPGIVVEGFATTRALATEAIRRSTTLSGMVARHRGAAIDLDAIAARNGFLPPIDHDDAAHLHLTGTGLTHLGSAEGRDKMHQPAAGGAMTDSMRMFRMGLDGGRPAPGDVGVQPEWFYKGDGSALVAPGAPLAMPGFAEDGGEEPEVAGIYLIDAGGVPRRLGFALANEFSDHVIERGNYLWLAHSKLRQAALGPELLLGDLPAHLEGTSRIVRDSTTLWEKPFLSGEANMSHSIANLEHHHFKYAQFRRPGDVHVHFFGTATLSFADGVATREGDVFEVSAPPFRYPVRNPLTRRPDDDGLVGVRPL